MQVPKGLEGDVRSIQACIKTNEKTLYPRGFLKIHVTGPEFI